MSSLEIAKMVDKRHDNLTRDIRGYVELLDSSNLRSRDFFIESQYSNSQNKEQPCYFLTRRGCNIVALKLTRMKGLLFTAAYVEKFYAMEQTEKEQQQLKLPNTYKEGLLH